MTDEGNEKTVFFTPFDEFRKNIEQDALSSYKKPSKFDMDSVALATKRKSQSVSN